MTDVLSTSAQGFARHHHENEARHEREQGHALDAVAVRLGNDLVADDEERGAGCSRQADG